MLFAHLKTLLCAVEVVLLSVTHSNASPTSSIDAYTTHQQARDLALSQLPESVRRDLERRSPDEYELDYDHHLWKRGLPDAAKGNVQTCANSGKDRAMTYDDGPFTFNRELADKYSKAGQQITYFVNVNNYDCSYNAPYPEDLQHAMSLGHTIGSHSGTHADFKTLTWKQIDEQIQLVETFAWDTLGIVPRFFRSPYGSTNDSINAYLQKRWGLIVVQWNVDSGDSVGATVQQSIANVTQAPPGSIILNHEVHETSVRQVAPAVIEYYKNHNIKSVNMQTCLNQRPYKVKRKMAPKRDATWDCKKRKVPAPGKSSV